MVLTEGHNLNMNAFQSNGNRPLSNSSPVGGGTRAQAKALYKGAGPYTGLPTSRLCVETSCEENDRHTRLKTLLSRNFVGGQQEDSLSV